MATKKKITMKQFNGTDYDTLYPKTIASQIPDVYSKSETYPKSQLYTQSQLYTRSQIDSMITQIDSMINTINTALDGKARIQTGSYVGTGMYGASNPCSLTFDFEPKLVIILGNLSLDKYERASGPMLVTMNGLTQSMSYLSGGTDFTVKIVTITWSNKKIEWYSSSGDNYQLNQNGITYQYLIVA